MEIHPDKLSSVHILAKENGVVDYQLENVAPDKASLMQLAGQLSKLIEKLVEASSYTTH